MMPDIDTTVTVQCPWCFESTTVWIDPQTRGQMVRDCEVCCRPWEMHVTRDVDGRLQVSVRRSN